MDMTNYYYDTLMLPQCVVIDLSFEVRRIRSFFGPNTEDVMRRIIDAVGDRVMYIHNVSKMVNQIYDGLYDARTHQIEDEALRRVSLFDVTITLEQMALSVQEKLAQHNLYLIGRFSPYLYEHTLSDGSVVLTKLGFTDFCDAYCLELYH